MATIYAGITIYIISKREIDPHFLIQSSNIDIAQKAVIQTSFILLILYWKLMVKLKTVSKFLKGSKLAIQLIGVAAEIIAASKALKGCP